MQQIHWTGPIIADVAILCYRAGQLDKWRQIISYMLNEQNLVVGAPKPDQIKILTDACLFGGHCASSLVSFITKKTE